METIEAVAVRKKGRTFYIRRGRHYQFFRLLGSWIAGVEFGFLSSEGRFLNREQGLIVAKAADQLRWKIPESSRTLKSVDVW